VFVSPIGSALDPRNMSREWDAMRKAANVSPVRFHDLRHTSATLVLAQGVGGPAHDHGNARPLADQPDAEHLQPRPPGAARAGSREARRHPDAIGGQLGGQASVRMNVLAGIVRNSGEPGGNRTPNPQIKSLLLCQLSYRPRVKSQPINA
jgi:hypothetical protein